MDTKKSLIDINEYIESKKDEAYNRIKDTVISLYGDSQYYLEFIEYISGWINSNIDFIYEHNKVWLYNNYEAFRSISNDLGDEAYPIICQVAVKNIDRYYKSLDTILTKEELDKELDSYDQINKIVDKYKSLELIKNKLEKDILYY